MTVTHDGRYTTFVGSRYVDGRHPNETNKVLRREIAALVKSGDLPALKYRVTRGYGWGSIDVTINVPDVDAWAFKPHGPGLLDCSEPSEPCYRPHWTDEAKRVGHVLGDLVDSFVEHTSDVYTDYFSGGYAFVYVSRSGVGGGLVLPKFPRHVAFPRWVVERLAGSWTVFCDSLAVDGERRSFGSWSEAIGYADARSRGQEE